MQINTATCPPCSFEQNSVQMTTDLDFADLKKKIYDLVICKLLPVISVPLAFVGGICAVIVSPVWILATIPAIAFAVLGIKNMVEQSMSSIASTENQPKGLPNKGNNCWINSSLQMILNAPRLEATLQTNGLFRLISQRYHAVQSQSIAEDIDSNAVRTFLHLATGGKVSALPVQEDAVALFEYLFSEIKQENGKPECLYTLTQVLKKASGEVSIEKRSEPMISLQMLPKRDSFDGYLMNFFNCKDDLGQDIQVFFDRPPEDLIIHFKRFYQDFDRASGKGARCKVGDEVEVPLEFDLPARCSISSQTQKYECCSFNVHRGALDGGHYVAYVKKGDAWWCCNDTKIEAVSLSEVERQIKNAYCIHFQQKTAP
jgi:hypothetical protein